LPDISQAVVLTCTTMRRSAIPNRETPIPLYSADRPVLIAVRASWPDELIIRCRLVELHRAVKAERLRRTALILVGRVLAASDYTDSKLYDAGHFHLFRPTKRRGRADRGES